jgi:2-dehydropantoate 2-reductase
VLACTWLEHGFDSAFLVTPNASVQKAWLEGRVTLNGTPLTTRIQPDRILTQVSDSDGPFDLAFLAVQPDQIAPTLSALVPRLSPGAEVVTLTNGLCDEQVAEVVGVERAVGAVVMWGARMTEPGRYVRTSKGGFVAGKLPAATTPISARALELLSWVGQAKVTSNLLGARFSKLALNSAISTLGTIGGQTLGRLLLRQDCRSLTLTIVKEAVAVAHAEGVGLESVTPLDMEWLARETPSAGSRLLRHLSLLLVGFRYRQLRSSMLAAVERGRTPAVDYLNGEIVRRGKALGVEVPVNEAARKLVWSIAHGDREPGRAALEALITTSRANS